MTSPHPHPPALEAKLVLLGAQNVGKTSLVHRHVHAAFLPPQLAHSTVGAAFLTTRAHDPESGTTLRLQIWDTAGQERFRSISRLYYRGANAAILCYDVTSLRSFEAMGEWLEELKGQCGGLGGLVVHVVGTKSDVVAADPGKREVPFERCIQYVAEQLFPTHVAPATAPSTNTTAAGPGSPPLRGGLGVKTAEGRRSNRSSGMWGQEHAWTCCHEISAKDGEGIDEVFRVITRRLVEQHAARAEQQRLLAESLLSRGRTPGAEGGEGEGGGYFDDLPNGGNGSFRVGHGNKRRSWLGFPGTPGALSAWTGDGSEAGDEREAEGRRRGRCC
ncbi:hypothetical protein LTR53_017115 [Teratosphaeriaceae sp. CCFEE 6253]|nr:hypothetical protein LTR53_017115 [Teratosphaeriaceae sp. CCFEE 6253]